MYMNNQIIGEIAAKNGWNVSVKELTDRVSFDFQRKTLSGVSFCFTAEMKDDGMEYLVRGLSPLWTQSCRRLVPQSG